MLSLRPPAHVIVLGNEKGGSGKSTTAMHLVVALLREGARVATFDLDGRQGTFSRYVENRRASAVADPRLDLPMPVHHRPALDDVGGFAAAMAEVRAAVDLVVVDCPGADTALARHAHTLADTLITPVNDSFVDVDVLGTVDPDSLAVTRLSHYAAFVWEQRKARALERRPPIDWLVMRNRISSRATRDKAHVAQVLDALARRCGFRVAPGFGDRVIFRELFLRGLTLLDLGGEVGVPLSMSHVAARQEVRALRQSLRLPPITMSDRTAA
jgi:chromosome partitioning protein